MDDKMLLEMFASLTREIGGVRQDVNDGFSRIEAHLARQGGIIGGGSRQIARLIEWSERIDQMIAQRDARIAELTQRIDRLEGKSE